MSDRYAQRGVSAVKEDVHKAIAHIDKGLFPKSFCKIVPDLLTKNEDYCAIMHAAVSYTHLTLPTIYSV